MNDNKKSKEQADEARTEIENLNNEIMERARDAIFTLSPQGVLVTINQAFEKVTGWQINEWIGKSFSGLVHPEDVSLAAQRLFNVLKGNTSQAIEVRILKKPGDYVYCEILASPLMKNGIIIGLLGIARDITEHKLVVEALRESEENFRVLFNENPLPTLLSEIPSGKITFANKRMAALVGMDPKEIQGKTANDLGLLKNPTDQENLTRLITSQGYVDSVEIDKVLPGRQAGTDLVFMRLVTISRKQYCLTVVQDITDRKRSEAAIIKAREKAEESDRLKSSFLANMSHEIRTPMNGILGFAELLKNQLLTGEEQHEYISIIEKSGARMLRILNDLIDISKIESGQMDVSISVYNINEQTEFINTFFRPVVDGKGIGLFVKNSLPLNEAIIKTDKEKVNAILTNLIRNAIKFTNEGSIEFGYEKKGKYLEFFVKDTGIGISRDLKKIIFERFRQGSESLARNYEGAGLGLSISKSFVEMLGGKIWMESKPGKGSEFYFTVPYNSEQREKSIFKNAVSGDEPDNHIRNLKILIAEDDKVSEYLLSNVLKIFSKEILTARTGVEAVEACRHNSEIDLVLMDIKMPEMDGYEATRQIRQFNKDVVIIAQTAYAQMGDREKALEAGCDDYVPKPVKKDELLATIVKHFKI